MIERLAEVLKPKRALLLAPSFSEYERALTRRGCHCAFHMLRREEGFQLTERVLDDLNEETELFWLCLPNNPTGLVPSEELFLRILSRCAERNITLITDECFFGFLNRDNAPSLRYHLRAAEGRARRILLGAFTKTFAMPGVRLGYCVSSDPALGEALFAAGQPWPERRPSPLRIGKEKVRQKSPFGGRNSLLACVLSGSGSRRVRVIFCSFRMQCRTQKRTRQGFALLRRADFRFATARTFAGFPLAIFELR